MQQLRVVGGHLVVGVEVLDEVLAEPLRVRFLRARRRLPLGFRRSVQLVRDCTGSETAHSYLSIRLRNERTTTAGDTKDPGLKPEKGNSPLVDQCTANPKAKHSPSPCHWVRKKNSARQPCAPTITTLIEGPCGGCSVFSRANSTNSASEDACVLNSDRQER